MVLSACMTGFHLVENALECLLLLPPDGRGPLCLIYTLRGIEPRPGKYSSNTPSPRQDSRYCLAYCSLQGTELTFLLTWGAGRRGWELAQ